MQPNTPSTPTPHNIAPENLTYNLITTPTTPATTATPTTATAPATLHAPHSRRLPSIDLSRHRLPAARPAPTIAAPLAPWESPDAPDEPAPDYAFSPFTVVQDNNEQLPFRFDHLHENASAGGRRLVVPVVVKSLHTGDYSIEGQETAVTIERKSPADARATFVTQRRRFEDELQRMSEMSFSAVVVECDWPTLLDVPALSGIHPRSLYFGVLAWQVRYPKVQWVFMPSRREAEAVCYWLLYRWWHERFGK